MRKSSVDLAKWNIMSSSNERQFPSTAQELEPEGKSAGLILRPREGLKIGDG
jgi:hypothetical protein